MPYSRQLESALTVLATTGMSQASYAPPLYRMLWRLGWSTAPPHFASFTFNLVFSGAWFGVIWGILMWFAMWSRQGLPPAFAAVLSLAAGLLFGLCMALYYRHGARKHALPSWSALAAGP